MDTYIWVVCGSKNRHQKDMWFKEIGLRTQILLIVLGSMVNVTVREGEESILPFTEHENLHFDNE
jgi:hypothetical protein